MNSVESTEFVELEKYFCKKMCIRTCYLLCSKSACYHSASKTLLTDRIFKLSPYLCISDLSYSLNSLNFLSILPYVMFLTSKVFLMARPFYI